jgi:hypothetical protein
MSNTEITHSAVSPRARRRGRIQLVALAIVFLVPMAAAVLYQPTAISHHGTLVEPARPLDDMTLVSLDSEPIALSSLFDKWNLVYFDPGECAAACESALYGIRQARAAQGRHASRVRAVLVVTGEEADGRRLRTLEAAFGGTVLGVPAAAADPLQAQFGADPAAPQIFLVDPLGNLMMRYPADADPNGIRKDIARLLRVSQVG